MSKEVKLHFSGEKVRDWDKNLWKESVVMESVLYKIGDIAEGELLFEDAKPEFEYDADEDAGLPPATHHFLDYQLDNFNSSTIEKIECDIYLEMVSAYGSTIKVAIEKLIVKKINHINERI